MVPKGLYSPGFEHRVLPAAETNRDAPEGAHRWSEDYTGALSRLGGAKWPWGQQGLRPGSNRAGTDWELQAAVPVAGRWPMPVGLVRQCAAGELAAADCCGPMAQWRRWATCPPGVENVAGAAGPVGHPGCAGCPAGAAEGTEPAGPVGQPPEAGAAAAAVAVRFHCHWVAVGAAADQACCCHCWPCCCCCGGAASCGGAGGPA